MKMKGKKVIALVIGFCITLATTLLFLPPKSVTAIIFALITLICACTAYAVLSLIDKQALKTWVHLAAIRVDNKLDATNVRTVSTYLLPFLYHVLEKNKSSLSINLASEPSCLLAPGNGINHRENSIFFRFACVIPEIPDMDLVTMRQVVQSYIWGELANYGIPGLRSYFQSRVYGALPSIYVDQIFYSESRHTLYIELLYVCTEEAAKYAVKAHRRDHAPVQSEKGVFDDEIC